MASTHEEDDLQTAARFGQMLLAQNSELEATLGKTKAQLARAQDALGESSKELTASRARNRTLMDQIDTAMKDNLDLTSKLSKETTARCDAENDLDQAIAHHEQLQATMDAQKAALEEVTAKLSAAAGERDALAAMQASTDGASLSVDASIATGGTAGRHNDVTVQLLADQVAQMQLELSQSKAREEEASDAKAATEREVARYKAVCERLQADADERDEILTSLRSSLASPTAAPPTKASPSTPPPGRGPDDGASTPDVAAELTEVQLRTAQMQVQQLTARLAAADSERQDLEARLADVEQRLSVSTRDTSRSASRVRRLIAEMEGLRHRLTSTQTAMAFAQLQRENLENQLTSAADEHAAAMDKLLVAAAGARSRQASAEAELDAAQERLRELEVPPQDTAAVAALQEEATQLKADVAAARAATQAADAAAAAAEHRGDDLQAALAASEAKAADLAAWQTQALKERTAAADEEERAASRYPALLAELKTKRAEIQELKAAAQQAAADAPSEDHERLRAELEAARATADSREEELAALRAALEDSTSLLEAAQKQAAADVDAVTAERDAAQTALEAAREATAAVQREVDTLSAQVTKARSQAQEANTTAAKHVARLTEVQAAAAAVEAKLEASRLEASTAASRHTSEAAALKAAAASAASELEAAKAAAKAATAKADAASVETEAAKATSAQLTVVVEAGKEEVAALEARLTDAEQAVHELEGSLQEAVEAKQAEAAAARKSKAAVAEAQSLAEAAEAERVALSQAVAALEARLAEEPEAASRKDLDDTRQAVATAHTDLRQARRQVEDLETRLQTERQERQAAASRAADAVAAAAAAQSAADARVAEVRQQAFQAASADSEALRQQVAALAPVAAESKLLSAQVASLHKRLEEQNTRAQDVADALQQENAVLLRRVQSLEFMGEARVAEATAGLQRQVEDLEGKLARAKRRESAVAAAAAVAGVGGLPSGPSVEQEVTEGGEARPTTPPNAAAAVEGTAEGKGAGVEEEAVVEAEPGDGRGLASPPPTSGARLRAEASKLALVVSDLTADNESLRSRVADLRAEVHRLRAAQGPVVEAPSPPGASPARPPSPVPATPQRPSPPPPPVALLSPAAATIVEDTVLGVDVGSTTVKCVLLSAAGGSLLASATVPTRASVSTTANRAEQDVSLIMAAIKAALRQLPDSGRARVVRVGVCGQMHGVVLWKKGTPSACSTLITWEDQRSVQFLKQLVQRRQLSGVRHHLEGLRSGYGVSTLAWLAANQPAVLQSFNCAGTIMDYVVTVLCGGNGAPVMEPTVAHSFGCFDALSSTWATGAVAALKIPVGLLPDIVAPDYLVANVTKGPSTVFGIPMGAKVYVAHGDHPCGVLAALREGAHAAVNIGTSAQFAAPVPAGVAASLLGAPPPGGVPVAPKQPPPPPVVPGIPPHHRAVPLCLVLALTPLAAPVDLWLRLGLVLGALAVFGVVFSLCDRRWKRRTAPPSPPLAVAPRRSEAWEVRPHVNPGCFLLVAASMNGGNAFRELADTARQWAKTVHGAAPPCDDDQLYQRLDKAAASIRKPSMRFEATFATERGDSAPARASIVAIQPGRLRNLGEVTMSLLQGIATNLCRMVPDAVSARGKVLAVSGGAVVRSRAMQAALSTVFAPDSLKVCSHADAAFGAALLHTKPGSLAGGKAKPSLRRRRVAGARA